MKPLKKIFYTLFIILSLLALPGKELWATVVGSSLFVSLREGRLTVRAIDVPLKRIVQEITRQMDTGRVMDIRVYGEPQVSTEKVTVEFHDLPIDEGLAKILAGYNAVYVYSSGGGEKDTSPYRLAEVWVFFQGRGETPRGQAGSEGGNGMVYLSGEDVEGHDPSSASRGASRGRPGGPGNGPGNGMEGPGGPGSRANTESSGGGLNLGDIEALISLLNDPDPTVRLSTIEALNGLDSQVTPEELKDLSLIHI